MLKIGVIPVTDANGQKHYLDVYDDGRAVLPDGTSRKLKKEVFDALMERYIQTAKENPAEENLASRSAESAPVSNRVQVECATEPSALQSTEGEGEQREVKQHANTDMPKEVMPDKKEDGASKNQHEDPISNDLLCKSDFSGNTNGESVNNEHGNIPLQAQKADKTEAENPDNSDCPPAEEMNKQSEANQPESTQEDKPAKKGKKHSKRILATVLALTMIITTLSGVGYLIYQRGGFSKGAFEISDGQQVIDVNGVVQIEYYAVITDGNGEQHQVKLSSLTLDDLQLKSILDASGRNMLN